MISRLKRVNCLGIVKVDKLLVEIIRYGIVDEIFVQLKYGIFLCAGDGNGDERP
jgi:hypothetical protein